MNLIRTRRRLASCLAITLLAFGVCGGAQAQARFVISADAQEVLDSQSKLSWRRCAEGMNWDGKTCSGKAGRFTYAAAKKQSASVASQTGQAWRLPTKAELQALVDKGQKKKPLIDGSAFPGTAAALFWASRPEANDNLNAWIVNFGNGRVYGNTGSKAVHTRLVRTAN